MKSISYDEAVQLVKEADHYSPEQLHEVQKERLKALVQHAKEHSPYFRRLYRDIPPDAALGEIPISYRSDLTKHFDEWVCDKEITSVGVENYLSAAENVYKQYLNQYNVYTTSGTTDKPLIMLRGNRHNTVNAAVISERYYGGSLFGGVERLRQPDCRTAGYLATNGYHASYITFLRMQKKLEEAGIKDSTVVIPIGTPLEEQMAVLNRFQPEFLGGYPSLITAIAYEQLNGNLNIHPLGIGCVAEYLSEENRRVMEEAFGCPIMNNYGCSECGEMALSCSAGHLHLNADWYILEPVDRDDRPVAMNAFSEGVLVTNLANDTQPIIRYRLSDRIRIHEEGCSCGSSLPWLEIEGRSEEMLTFSVNGREKRLSPIPFCLLYVDTPGCAAGQFIQRSPSGLEIRFSCTSTENSQSVGETLLKKTKKLLAEDGLAGVTVTLSNATPIRGKTGKIRSVFKSFAE